MHLPLLVLGLAFLAKFADLFVDGAAKVAARLRVSTVVTGALIIGFGTSAPELVVSTLTMLTKGTEGTALAMGNIVGSNVANLMLVLPIPALIFGSMTLPTLVFGSVGIEKGVKRQAVLFGWVKSRAANPSAMVMSQAALSAFGVTVFAALVFFVEPSRWWGGVLLALMFGAFGLIYWLGDRFGGVPPPDTTEGLEPWVSTVAGLVGTVGFAYLVVWSATSIADDMGWTGGFVGFALVAVGTSLPELVTVLAAARRGESGLIIGNLLGSNLFNSLMVGAAVFLTGRVTPYDEVSGLPGASLLLMVAASWIVIVFMRTGRRIGRIEAACLIIVYAGFLGWLAANFATA